MKQSSGTGRGIDLTDAVRIVDAFAASCGIPCRLVDAEGVVLYLELSGLPRFNEAYLDCMGFE